MKKLMKKVLIIGGGVAGLSAGIYSLVKGYDVTVCERCALAGGHLGGWQREGYKIDNCIHWFTGSNPQTETYRMWEELGLLDGAEIYFPETLYTSEYGGEKISLNIDENKTAADMMAASPEDEAQITELFRAVKMLENIMLNTAGKSLVLPLLKEFMNVPILLSYSKMSIEELSLKFKSPLLRCFLTDLMDKHFSSFALLITYAIFCGRNGGVLCGGSRAAADRMVDKFLSFGGKLLTNKRAVKINVYDGKADSVTFADGEAIGADYFISAVPTSELFGSLLSVPMPEALKSKYDSPDFIRFSSYQLAFSADKLPLPFKKELVYDLPAKYAFPLGKDRMIVYEYSHEPSFAPEGKMIIQTMIYCLEEECARFVRLRNEDYESYKAEKKRIADITESALKEKFPGLKDSLKFLDMWTPATYNRYTGEEVGAFMSFIFPRGSWPTIVDGRIKEVRNLIMASQWLQTPGGLPIAADLGMRAAIAVDEAEKSSRKFFFFPIGGESDESKKLPLAAKKL